MIRATTGGVLRSYRSNLMNSFIRDNSARTTVLTQRVFNSYADDPAAAAKSFRLRKSRMMASSQLRICDDTYHKFQVAYSSLQSVSQLIDTENGGSTISTLKETTLRMLNDPTGDARTQLNEVLDNLSDTIVQMMNQTYGDEFIFAGADGYNVPFVVKTEADGTKRLYYRDVPVDVKEANVWKDANGPIEVDEDGTYPATAGGGGYYLVMDNVTPMSQQEYEDAYPLPDLVDKTIYKGGEGAAPPLDELPEGDYYKYTDDNGDEQYISVEAYEEAEATRPQYMEYPQGSGEYLVFDGDPKTISKTQYEQDKSDYEKLRYLANEKHFIDIGLGFKEDANGKLIETSAFNDSLSGLTFLGYGLDEDGDPKNIYSIVQRLKDLAGSVPNEEWSTVADEFDRLVGKLEDAASDFKTQFTNQSAGTQKLKTSYDILDENVYNLKEQYSNLEDVNMADAITSFIWAEYCYNAALKVGNSILSQSLMDYLS